MGSKDIIYILCAINNTTLSTVGYITNGLPSRRMRSILNADLIELPWHSSEYEAAVKLLAVWRYSRSCACSYFALAQIVDEVSTMIILLESAL